MNTPTILREHPRFAADFERLRAVTLNPARHTAPNAHAHSLWVASRAGELAILHDCTPDEASTLEALGLVHDIGKIHGTTAPAKSVELLPDYGIDDPRFVDRGCPWFPDRGETSNFLVPSRREEEPYFCYVDDEQRRRREKGGVSPMRSRN